MLHRSLALYCCVNSAAHSCGLSRTWDRGRLLLHWAFFFFLLLSHLEAPPDYFSWFLFIFLIQRIHSPSSTFLQIFLGPKANFCIIYHILMDLLSSSGQLTLCGALLVLFFSFSRSSSLIFLSCLSCLLTALSALLSSVFTALDYLFLLVYRF